MIRYKVVLRTASFDGERAEEREMTPDELRAFVTRWNGEAEGEAVCRLSSGMILVPIRNFPMATISVMGGEGGAQ